jgi:probable rRNA maturation factor
MPPAGNDRRRGLRFVIADEQGRRLRLGGLSSWLHRVAPARARGDISIALVSDRRIRALNRAYRRRDYATDVLSFPSNPESQSSSHGTFLGDIVIARGVAERQARAAGHSNLTELRVLALHGLLHLLGYDHQRDMGEMRRVEERLRRKGGLRESVIERGRAVDSLEPLRRAKARSNRAGGGASARLRDVRGQRRARS